MGIRRLPGRTAYRLTWLADQVEKDAKKLLLKSLLKILKRVEQESKGRLYYGHGLETGTLKRSIHFAGKGYPWASDHVEPSYTTPERGHRPITLEFIGRRLYVEFGSGQHYALFYHQKYDRFLREPWEKGMNEFRREVEATWRTSL